MPTQDEGLNALESAPEGLFDSVKDAAHLMRKLPAIIAELDALREEVQKGAVSLAQTSQSVADICSSVGRLMDLLKRAGEGK